MKIVELRAKTFDQLQLLLSDLKKEFLNLRFRKATSELTNVSRIRQVKKDIARLNTRLREINLKVSSKKKGDKDA